jgi:hypothetical protein
MATRILPPSPVAREKVALIAGESGQTDRINPRWLRIPAAVKYSGINRSRLFKLIKDGEVQSASLQEKPGAKRGVRLVDRLSLDLLLERLCRPVEQRLVEEAQSVEVQEKALAQKKAQIAGQLAAIRERKKGGDL